MICTEESQGLHQAVLKRAEEQDGNKIMIQEAKLKVMGLQIPRKRGRERLLLWMCDGAFQRMWSKSSFKRKDDGFPSEDPTLLPPGDAASPITKSMCGTGDVRHPLSSAPNCSRCVGTSILRLWAESLQLADPTSPSFYSYMHALNTHCIPAVSSGQAHRV